MFPCFLWKYFFASVCSACLTSQVRACVRSHFVWLSVLYMIWLLADLRHVLRISTRVHSSKNLSLCENWEIAMIHLLFIQTLASTYARDLGKKAEPVICDLSLEARRPLVYFRYLKSPPWSRLHSGSIKFPSSFWQASDIAAELLCVSLQCRF